MPKYSHGKKGKINCNKYIFKSRRPIQCSATQYIQLLIDHYNSDCSQNWELKNVFFETYSEAMKILNLVGLSGHVLEVYVDG